MEVESLETSAKKNLEQSAENESRLPKETELAKTTTNSDEFLKSGEYFNEDLSPVPHSKRTWKTRNFVALWISMALCIPSYMLASSLIDGGMNWYQSMISILLGNLIVLIPMVLNGFGGATYGIPFPVLARTSFGIRGAQIPCMLRAIVACGWFGIQTWIGGSAIYEIIYAFSPNVDAMGSIFPDWLSLKTIPALTFLFFWGLNVLVIYLGIESIRKLLIFKAFILPILSILIFVWAVVVGGGFGPILAQPSQFKTDQQFWLFFLPALTGIVGNWATLSLNVSDFTRYATNQKSQIIGQTISLPLSMTAFSFVGIVVTSATTLIYGQTIWDPIQLSRLFSNPFLVTVAMTVVIFSTLATNITANIVSPANDFSNLMPSKITFKRGGYITAIIGILICPWKLLESADAFIFRWLIAYSALLGPIVGIMIVDYFIISHQSIVLEELYTSKNSRYWYKAGFNWTAIFSLFAGIAPNVPGFFAQVDILLGTQVPAFFDYLYDGAWFLGCFLSGFIYWLLNRRRSFVPPASIPKESEAPQVEVESNPEWNQVEGVSDELEDDLTRDNSYDKSAVIGTKPLLNTSKKKKK